MSPKPRAVEIRVLVGVKEKLFKRHRKNLKLAEDAWAGLVARIPTIRADAQFGEPIPKRLRPIEFRDYNSLYLVPELPHRFRAIYELSSPSPSDPVVVTFVRIGDHHEYDTLFGYGTS